MKLRVSAAVVLFLLGAIAGLIGDHSHVATETTVYYTDAVPYVWSSPIWFPASVGAATVSLAELRLWLPAVRVSVTARQALAGVAAVVGMYCLTALMHTGPTVPVTALITALAIIIWCALGDAPAIICGALAAVLGPAVETAMVAGGVFRYADSSDELFGVAPFLGPLYFAFGVVAALLGESADGYRRHRTPASS